MTETERRVLSCGCRADFRDGRLLGFNRVCATAGALLREQMSASSEERAAAVGEQLRRHATT